LGDGGGVRFPAVLQRFELAGVSRDGAGRADGKGTAIGTIGIEQMAKVSPVKFFKEVRDEVRKVTWPSRRETTITTIMVFAFAFVAAVFFLLADQVIRVTVTMLLGIGS
jgi:preprotein translocase subunit SecE